MKNKNNMPVLIGVDVGYGETKVISSANGQVVFPSFVSEGSIDTRIYNSSEIDLEYLEVEVEEGRFLVGEQASSPEPDEKTNRTTERSRAKDEKSRVLFKTAIALGVPHEAGEHEVFLVTGLPNDDFGTQIEDDLAEFLKKPFTISFRLGRNRSIEKKIKVTYVDVLRQPEGSLLNRMFSFVSSYSGGSIIERTLNAKNHIGIIDIGHGTTDYALFRKALIVKSDNACGSTVATTEVYERLRTKIQQKLLKESYQYMPTDEDLDQVVRTKSVKIKKSVHDVTKEVNEAVFEVAQQIVKSVVDAWGNRVNTLDEIVLTGGGASLFSNTFDSMLTSKKIQVTEIEDEPQMSNVRGFYLHAVIRYLDESEDVDLDRVYRQYVQPVKE